MHNLGALRQEIDKLDDEWLTILSKRFATTRKVGEYKAYHYLPAIDKQREQEQYKAIREKAELLNLNPDMVEKILRIVITEVVLQHGRLKENTNPG